MVAMTAAVAGNDVDEVADEDGRGTAAGTIRLETGMRFPFIGFHDVFEYDVVVLLTGEVGCPRRRDPNTAPGGDALKVMDLLPWIVS